MRRCRFTSDLFDTELIIRSERAGLSVAELPARAEDAALAHTDLGASSPNPGRPCVLRVTLSHEARRRA